jgi:hypothetical protein
MCIVNPWVIGKRWFLLKGNGLKNVSLQDVTKLTPLSREIISRQATINIGKNNC